MCRNLAIQKYSKTLETWKTAKLETFYTCRLVVVRKPLHVDWWWFTWLHGLQGLHVDCRVVYMQSDSPTDLTQSSQSGLGYMVFKVNMQTGGGGYMVYKVTRFKCRVVVGSPGKRLPRPLHPVLLYFSHASRRESFSLSFSTFSSSPSASHENCSSLIFKFMKTIHR